MYFIYEVLGAFSQENAPKGAIKILEEAYAKQSDDLQIVPGVAYDNKIVGKSAKN